MEVAEKENIASESLKAVNLQPHLLSLIRKHLNVQKPEDQDLNILKWISTTTTSIFINIKGLLV